MAKEKIWNFQIEDGEKVEVFVLFALNFVFIMGGALGAVASVLGAYAVHHVACRTEKSNAVKVGLCIAIYVAITIISTFIVGLLYF